MVWEVWERGVSAVSSAAALSRRRTYLRYSYVGAESTCTQHYKFQPSTLAISCCSCARAFLYSTHLADVDSTHSSSRLLRARGGGGPGE